MTDEQTKIIEKIKKLLALAGSSNEHEAALAAERAQALLIAHNLSMSDVKTQTEKDVEVTHGDALTTSSHPWRRPLGQAVAQLYFCTYIYTTKNSKDRHYFIGKSHNVLVAQMIFTYLCQTIDTLARRGALQVPLARRSPYRVSFRSACSLRVRFRIMERIKAAEKGEVKNEQGTNLPAVANMYLIATTQNENYLHSTFGKPRTKESKLAILHADGAVDGDAAGKTIGLDQQVGTNKASHMIE